MKELGIDHSDVEMEKNEAAVPERPRHGGILSERHSPAKLQLSLHHKACMCVSVL